MSSSSSPVRRRRPRRASRARNRPSQHVAISTVVRSVLVVTVVSSIAIGTYFAFTDDVLTRLIGRQQNTYEDHIAELRAQIDRIESSKFLDKLTALQQRQATLEQRTSALTSELSATGTIKPERIASPEATPTEKPTVPINDIVFAPPERIAPPETTPAEKSTPASPIDDTAIFFGAEREARVQSPELPTSTTTKHHRIYRAAHHRASLRHRVAPLKATPAAQSPQLTSAITKPDAKRRRSMTQ